MAERINTGVGPKYPKEVKGKIIAVDPKKIPFMSSGRAGWFNPDGTARSVADVEGKPGRTGSDDGDKLG